MNTSGEVADLMVKEGIQITESTAKLAGLGAKNLAAIIMALVSDNTKLQGKTSLKQLLKSEKPLCIVQIKQSDFRTFNDEAKKYGVLFTAVTDKTKDTGLCDIIAKEEDVTKLNYIMEKMGYAAPKVNIEQEKEKDIGTPELGDKSKNQYPRAKENQQESEFMKHGVTGKTDSDIDKKTSVKKKIEEFKQQKKSKKAPQKERNQLISPRFTKRNKKGKERQ